MANLQAIINTHGASAPRYTSYPTAPSFKEGDGQAILTDNLSLLEPGEAVSIYLHIPFCDRLCWFCGCNTKHTLKYAPIANYVDYLTKEIKMIGAMIGRRTPVSMIHFGGGSPSMLQPLALTHIRQALDLSFDINSETEICFEIDPSDGLDHIYQGLMDFGITRASIGVQDFNDEVQQAINRPQSFDQTRNVVERLRELGVQSVNIDALYGLPFQNETRLLDTLQKCVSLEPDRIALFGYAHVPWVKPHQKMIDERSLPNTKERFAHAETASAYLVAQNYEAIGIDHFAKPNDSLAIAAKAGHLRRNFQGYTTDNTTTLIGFGASAIGRGKAGYVQNSVATNSYKSRLETGEMTAQKGYRLNNEDRFRASLIERLMCDFQVNLAHFSKAEQHFVHLAMFDAQLFKTNDPFDLLRIEEERLVIPQAARPFARIVAKQFDQYASGNGAKFSKAI